MTKYPYVDSFDKIPHFFEKIRTSEIPHKFTYRYFSRIGFSSSKDRSFVSVLRKLGFIDQKGKPTDDYITLRDDHEFSNIMRRGLVRAYENLFKLEEVPQNVSEDVLNGYFSRLTGETYDRCVAYTKTFLALSKLAELPGDIEQKRIDNKKEEKIKPSVNLVINLPTSTDGKVYEVLFKHLKDLLNL